MVSTLRTYLNHIESEINVINKKVDPGTQVGDLVSQSAKTILFQHIKGYPGWKICDLLVNNRQAQATALKTTPDKVLSDLAKMYSNGKGKVNLVTTGPVKEKILKGRNADLTKIPFCVHSPKDAGPYLGSGMCVVKDPETGTQNVAMHRMYIKSKKHTAFHLTSPHNTAIYRKYQNMKKPMPMAVVIGHHPCWEIAACYSGIHEGYSEHEMAGSLLDEAVNIVPCETIDVAVPADAEIVLEGVVPPDVLDDEGPFGEGILYYSKTGKRPVFKLKTITMRKDAIFRHLNSTPFTDHQPLASLSFEVRLFTQLKQRFDVHDVHAPPWFPLSMVIQLTAQTQEQVREALIAAMVALPWFGKTVIAVDRDVDIYDAQDLFHVLATRVNPATDVIIIDGTSGFFMDRTTKQNFPGEAYRVGSKMGIDATKAPLMKPKEREQFERVSPKGWGNTLLKDFLDTTKQARKK